MTGPLDLSKEFIDRADNGEVGDRLVSETDRVRVWDFDAKPGDHLRAPAHELDQLWTIHGPGRDHNHQLDGTFFDVDYATGDTSTSPSKMVSE